VTDNNNTSMFEYMCRRCGEVHAGGIAGYNTVFSILVELTRKDGPASTTGATVCLRDIHSCKDGGLGISDLIGASLYG